MPASDSQPGGPGCPLSAARCSEAPAQAGPAGPARPRSQGLGQEFYSDSFSQTLRKSKFIAVLKIYTTVTLLFINTTLFLHYIVGATGPEKNLNFV